MASLKKTTLDGNVETLLLAVLVDGPSYGYAIVRELNQRAEGLLEMGEGTVYPVLHRLEKRKLVAGVWRKGETGRPRKYYRLTPSGRRALSENRKQWAGLVKVMEAVVGSEKNDGLAGVAGIPGGQLKPNGGVA